VRRGGGHLQKAGLGERGNAAPDLERGYAHARAALAQMEARRIAPTPENFKIWYNYCSGSARALRRTIDVLISNDQEFTPNLCRDLYEQFFGNVRQSEKARLISQRIEASVRQALGMLNSVGEEARHYTETLGETAASLGKLGELARVRDVIQSVMTETQEMIERSALLEHELSQSGAEIRALRKQVEDISREALTDALTGIGNRKLFDQRLKQFVGTALEHGTELSLLMLDIDHFKTVNDRWGHQLGDDVLRIVARSLIDGIKGRDQAARYGGEEFAILLPGTRLTDAAKLGDQLRESVAGKAVVRRETQECLGSVTLSVGVACYRLGEAPARFVERADAALYRAKQAGRNRVVTELPAEDC
jgi:diguanylate cyclase